MELDGGDWEVGGMFDVPLTAEELAALSRDGKAP
jgi:hypothetical protein